jgi:hypothetical protein
LAYFCSAFFSAAFFCASTVRRDNAIFTCISHDLAEVLVGVGDENVYDVTGIGLRTEFRQEFCEIGVAHAVNSLLRELPNSIQLVDDARFVGRRFFIIENATRFPKEMEKSDCISCRE